MNATLSGSPDGLQSKTDKLKTELLPFENNQTTTLW
jgi:hypothetical protein